MPGFSFSEHRPETTFHVICVHANHHNSVLTEVLGDLSKRYNFIPNKGETLTHSAPHETTLLLGIGDPSSMLDWEEIGASIYKHTCQWPSGIISITVPEIDAPQGLAALASGIDLRSWDFLKYKTVKKKEPPSHEYVVVTDKAHDARKHFEQFSAINEGNKAARFVVNEPSNILYPDSYARLVHDDLTKLGVKISILDAKRMSELGMNALLSVAQGSQHEARLVVLEYNGGDSKEPPMAFVGKGVTFDTGGISIKPSAKMEEMKGDMGGSAAVYGLFKALALRNAPVNAVGVLGLVENMPSGTAYKPGDILTSASGLTIEVLNTDAEGRLVLADALWYAQTQFKPKFVIDLATLTGAITVALGHEFAGIFTNDSALYDQVFEASKQTGELVWRMPLHENYDKDIDSSIADVQNTGSGRGAGSATAAHFLKRFIQDDMKWMHIDIAGVAWDSKPKTLFEKGATGFGVRLLEKFIQLYYEID